MKLTLANIEQRESEARQALEAQILRQKAAIEIRHKEEKAELYSRLEPSDPSEQVHGQQFPTDQNFEEDLGPSLEY